MATPERSDHRDPDAARPLRVLVEVVHPAHVLFFVNPIKALQASGHEVLVASRDKDVTLALLEELAITHRCLSRARTGAAGLAIELVGRDIALLRLVRRFRPQVMCGFGGVAISHIGRLLRIPAIGFYDTDHAVLQQRLTLPFIDQQYVPEVYDGPERPGRMTRFRGIKALSYLHPDRFLPDRERAISAGLDAGRPNFLVRTISWEANHDIGRSGWTGETLRAVVAYLAEHGRVHISAEGELPGDLAQFAYRGSVADFHHLLARCSLYVGESATIATEALLLGVPAVYAIDDRRSYIDELEHHGLVVNAPDPSPAVLIPILEDALRQDRTQQLVRRDLWLSTQVDLAAYVVERILAHARGPLLPAGDPV